MYVHHLAIPDDGTATSAILDQPLSIPANLHKALPGASRSWASSDFSHTITRVELPELHLQILFLLEHICYRAGVSLWKQ